MLGAKLGVTLQAMEHGSDRVDSRLGEVGVKGRSGVGVQR